MTELNDVAFDRVLNAHDGKEQAKLCVFSDASQEAFGACAYTRQKLKDDTYSVKFVSAKSRVAPLKKLSIPRLEIQAAVLASRLAKTIQEQTRIKFDDVVYFTDSTITLAWIQSTPTNFKPFVSSRIGEIQDNSNPSQWRHIPGKENVADDVSRGISVKYLNARWMNGPSFLSLPEEEWPQETAAPPVLEAEEMEYRKVRSVHTVKAVKIEEVIDPTRFSNWRKLIRVTAFVRRFAKNIRTRQPEDRGSQLTPEEKSTQRIAQSHEMRRFQWFKPLRRCQQCHNSWWKSNCHLV